MSDSTGVDLPGYNKSWTGSFTDTVTVYYSAVGGLGGSTPPSITKVTIEGRSDSACNYACSADTYVEDTISLLGMNLSFGWEIISGSMQANGTVLHAEDEGVSYAGSEYVVRTVHIPPGFFISGIRHQSTVKIKGHPGSNIRSRTEPLDESLYLDRN